MSEHQLIGDFDRLPCGCLMGNIGEAFIFRPCSLLCEHYLYVVAEAKAAGMPVETHIEP